jgi:acetyl-CoA C-acetyltransferase
VELMAVTDGIRGKAYLAGVYEHPQRRLSDVSTAQIFADVAFGALADAGLGLADVDSLYCDGTYGGLGGTAIAEYLGIEVSHLDTTELGGASYLAHVGHAATAIAMGKTDVALILLAGKARTPGAPRGSGEPAPATGFERPYGSTTVADYALAARRHMYEYGTTSADLAAVKVAASHHAQYNPNAYLPKKVTVEEVLDSPYIADPLHRLDCCVMTDGGGALVVVSPEVARSLDRTCVRVLGHGEGVKHSSNGRIDLTYTAAVRSGPAAFAEARVTPADLDYVSIYDSFTITVLLALEDLGFCAKGAGGRFVRDGRLQAPDGGLPFNTDGGGLCNNHPVNRGGMTKVIEAVRQLRGEAHPEVQVPNCRLALAHGNGGSLGNRSGAATLILEAEDA